MEENIIMHQDTNTSESESTSCPWCGSKDINFKTLQKGYQEPELFKIFCCDSCNTSYSLPRVNNNTVYELIYKNANKVQGYNRYRLYQERVLTEKKPLNYLTNKEPSYWGTAQAIKQVLQLDRSAKILEVGSGLGYFTYSLRKDGFNIHGLDISQEAVNNAIEKFGNFYICDDLHHFAELNFENYDLVIMTEVIEHLNEPKEFLLSINKLLKNNGVFVFTTPNKSFYPKDISWYTDAPPVHCWWFSEKSIEHIASILNMRLDFIDFTKYYKKHPFINKIVNIDDSGHFVFDKYGNVIKTPITKPNDFQMPQWVKKNRIYNKIRNYLFTRLFPNKYKTGGIQSNVICAILYKNN